MTASLRVLAPSCEAFRLTHPAVEIMMHTGDQADGIAGFSTGRMTWRSSRPPSQLPRPAGFLPSAGSPLRFVCLPQTVQCGELVRHDPNAEFDWSVVRLLCPNGAYTKDMLDDLASRPGDSAANLCAGGRPRGDCRNGELGPRCGNAPRAGD